MILIRCLLFGLWIALMVTMPFAQRRAPKKRPVQTNQPNSQANKQWESLACLPARSFYWFKNNYDGYTREDALRTRSIIAKNPEWTKPLPCCPETFDYVREADMWEETSLSLLSCFHPGAGHDVRTSKMFHRVTSSRSGQQCTYNQQGNLIRPGNDGAGTPDFVSPTVSEEEHWLYDVYPWTRLTVPEYNGVWKPNPGCDTPVRYRLNPNAWTNLWMYVKRGDVLSFTGGMGKVKFDVEGNMTGPEGSLVIPKTGIGLIGRILYENPIPTAPPGALIGAVYQGEFRGNNNSQMLDMADLTAGFLIGKGTVVTIEADGYLVLGINDGFLENNTGWLEITVKRSGGNRRR